MQKLSILGVFLLALCNISYAGQVTQCDMGTNGGLHPDCIYFPEGKSDGVTSYKFWCMHTPLPECEEYPTACVSNDFVTWATPNGVTNPVVQQNADTSGAECEFDADPDILYVDKYSKWFMITGPEVQISPRKNALQWFYSSDGENWTAYAGTTINGNTNPTILHGDDSGSAAWEGSNTQYPTCIFDEQNRLGVGKDTFWCWYGETVSGNNIGEMGCFTFTWDNLGNNIENFERCNASTHGADNPVLSPALDANYQAGMGHVDVVWDYKNERLEAMMLRDSTVAGLNFDIVKYTSTDGVNWSDQGLFLDVATSATHSCTGNQMYRSTYLHDGEGNKIYPETIMYSMSCSSGGNDYGVKSYNSGDPTNDGLNINKLEKFNTVGRGNNFTGSGFKFK